MSTGQTLQIKSSSLEETLSLGERIGSRLRGGEVIELTSDLGGGKTSFVRGLAKGAGSTDGVRSPSFTLSNEYRAPSMTIHHFDFYRLKEPGIMRDELAELVGEPDSVVVVEWAEIVEDVLPQEKLLMNIISTGENSRNFEFKYPENLSYLIEGES